MKLYYKIIKPLILTVLLCCFCINDLSAGVERYTEKTRRINKEFDVNSDATVEIENRFGKVHINTWEENRVELAIEIIVQDRNEDRASDRLDDIEININATSELVTVRTVIDDNWESRGFQFSFTDMTNWIFGEDDNRKIEINYTLSMPKSNHLDLENLYGDTYIDDISGDARLNIKYGSLQAEKFTGSDTQLFLGYGNAEIEEIRNAEIEVRYSSLEVDKCETMDLESKYTKVEIEEVDQLEAEVKYGELNVESVISIEGEMKYVGFEIGELLNDADLIIGYGPAFEIDFISKDFENIEIEANFTSVHLKFEEGAQFELDAEASFGDIDVDHDLDEDANRARDHGGHTTELRFDVGNADPTKTVDLEVSYGNIELGLD